MYKLNFNELVNNYIEKIKSRQLKRKIELLDILLLVILGLTFLGVIASLICNLDSLSLLLDFIMIIEVYFFMPYFVVTDYNIRNLLNLV